MKVPTVAPHPHQHLRFTVNVLGFGHSNRCVMESMWFSLHFPDDPEYWTSLDAYLTKKNLTNSFLIKHQWGIF